MAKSETRKPKKVGRPPMAMPEPIPDTLENVMDAVLSTPPKKRGEWKYLQKHVASEGKSSLRRGV